MKKITNLLEFDKADKHIYFLLLSAPVLLSLYWYYGSADNYSKIFTEFSKIEIFNLYAHIFQFVTFFFLVFLIPVLYIRFFIKKPLIYFGLGLGDKKFGFILLAILLPIIAIFMYFSTAMPDLQEEYPLARILFHRKELILWYEMSYVAFYYIAWEFYFRGFLLFGLKDRFGTFNAILIQTISSGLKIGRASCRERV